MLFSAIRAGVVWTANSIMTIRDKSSIWHASFTAKKMFAACYEITTIIMYSSPIASSISVVIFEAG